MKAQRLMAAHSQRRAGEYLLAIAIFVVASALALWSLSRTGVYTFYESQFAPAVSFACGGAFDGLVEGASELEPLSKFLARSSKTLSCSELPGDLSRFRQPQNPFQAISAYLLGSVALIWRVTGPSWSAVVPIAALFVGIFATALYGVARLFVGPIWALIVTLTATLSPMHIAMMPQLRDNAKAPFLLATIFFVGVAFFGKSRARSTACAVAAGIAAGLGYGFRSDLLIAIPFAVAAAILAGCCRPAERLSLANIATSLGVFFLGFLSAAAFAIFSAYGSGGLLGHVALLGLATPFNASLELTPTFYDTGHLYLDYMNDHFVRATDLMREGGPPPPYPFVSPEYERQAVRAYLTYVANFPADMWVRTLSAVDHVYNLDFPSLLSHTEVSSLPQGQFREFWMPNKFGAAVVMVAATLVGLLAGRRVLYFLLVALFFPASTVLQFDGRHAFYLEFIYWLSLVTALAGLLTLLTRGGTRSTIKSRVGYWALPACAAALMGLGVPVLRAYQSPHVQSLANQYRTADLREVILDKVAAGDTILFTPTGPVLDLSNTTSPFDEAAAYRFFYFVLEVDPSKCGASAFTATLKYNASTPIADFTRVFHRRDDPRAAPLKHRIFFPASFSPLSRFSGILVNADQAPCVLSLSSVVNDRKLPLPLWLQVTSEGAATPAYQKMMRIFGMKLSHEPLQVVSNPSALLDRVSTENLSVLPFESSGWAYVDKTASAGGNGVVIDGVPAGAGAPAAIFKPARFPKGAVVAAKGFGSTKASLNVLDLEGRYLASVEVPAGSFFVALAIPEDGLFRIQIDHRARTARAISSIKFEEIGLLKQ